MDFYSVIKRPLVTEKSTRLKEVGNNYCFEVDPRADKNDIRTAVEKLFRVKVVSVRTMQYEGKERRVGRSVGVRRNWKKAIVTLKEGSSIELFEGA